MSVRRRAALVVVALVGAVLSSVGGAPPAPAAAASGYVTMVSESGDYIGQGIARTYRSNITYSLTETSAHVAAGPFTFDFVAPDGQSLTPARYSDATRYPFQEAGEPGLDVSGDGRGCNQLTGSFTVLDLGPDRVWIFYEQHCEGGDAAVFGEIRLGYGEATSPLGVEAGIIGFPSEYPGVAVRPYPVRVANNGTSTATVTSAVVAGGADFSIISNGCAAALAPGASCTVHVGWTPTRAGVRLGMLEVADDRGNLREISLSGVGTSGRTRWQMSGDAGDYISGGRSYTYTPQTGARMGGGGTETIAWMSADHADDWWTAEFMAPSGQILLPGHTYTGATRYPFNSGNAGLDVSGSGRGCNTLTGQFTVHEATYDNGILTGFRIAFEQHCEGAVAALRGEVSWRAADPDAPVPDTTPPGPVTNLARGAGGASVPLTWTNPSDADWVDTVILGASGTSAVTEGRLVYDGRRQSTVVTGFPTWAPYTLSVFTEDTSGNLSPVRTVTIPASTSAPPPPTTPPPTTSTTPATPTTSPTTTSPTTSPTPTTEARTVALRAVRLSRREVRLQGRAGEWAAGARGVLQRRTNARWRAVDTKRLSPRGGVRWRLTLPPRPVARFRLVVRVDGRATTSAPVLVSASVDGAQ
jgi:heat shock protein HslJ